MLKRRSFILLTLTSLILQASADASKMVAAKTARTVQSVKEQYDKKEVYIPMRDGVKLFTSIYTPKDHSQKYPIMMKRTPYSVAPYGPDKYRSTLGPSPHFTKSGYIFVLQDVRGRYMSYGKFKQVTPHIDNKKSKTDIDESTDTYDTIAWVLKNVANHNGRVGQWGISYPGFYSAAGMIDAHPALKAVSPQAPVMDWFFDDFQHHGAFFLAHAFRWLSSNSGPREKPTTSRPSTNFHYPTQDGYKFFMDMGPMSNANKKYLKNRVAFWNAMMKHPNRDEFWKKRNLLPHLKNVAPAVMTVAGWYDAEDLYGSFTGYRSLEKQNPNVQNVLVVGPWYHGGWARSSGDHLGAVYFDSKTSEYFREHIQFPFFEKHLKDANVKPLPEATVFETGSNHWRTYEKWPPANSKNATLYAHAGGKLSFEKAPASNHSYFEFVSDPNRPVPFIENKSPYMTREYMVDDQRFAAQRPDVVVYQSEVLKKDLTVAGRMKANLWVSTSRQDADWVVKLIDVFPDGAPNNKYTPPQQTMSGYQMMIRSEVIRGRFRNSFEKPEPFTPNKPTKVSLTLQDSLHRFKKGHRIMIQIQSSWFPLVDRNPQKWVPNIFFAKDSDFKKAKHRVYHSPQYPTQFQIEVIPNSDS